MGPPRNTEDDSPGFAKYGMQPEKYRDWLRDLRSYLRRKRDYRAIAKHVFTPSGELAPEAAAKAALRAAATNVTTPTLRNACKHCSLQTQTQHCGQARPPRAPPSSTTTSTRSSTPSYMMPAQHAQRHGSVSGRMAQTMALQRCICCRAKQKTAPQAARARCMRSSRHLPGTGEVPKTTSPPLPASAKTIDAAEAASMTRWPSTSFLIRFHLYPACNVL